METKQCKKCNEIKELTEFHVSRRNKTDGRHSWCKECSIKNRLEHYRRNTEVTKARNKQRKFDMKRKVFKYLSSHPCVDCGEADPIVLDFDHVTGEKKLEVSTMATRGWAWNTILKEIGKCEVRCANCHRRRTAKDRDHYKYLDG